jgi:protein-S-isoprenylcysteine O-methyltransferase Ste14
VCAAAFLATVWNLPALLALHALAVRAGWWRYEPAQGTAAGFPVDLWIGWALLWGALPVLAARGARLALLTGAAFVVDLLAMQHLAPVVTLGRDWLAGEVAALVVCFVPGQLLAAWTIRRERVEWRAALQTIAFAGLTLGVLPQAILELTGGSWAPLFARPSWQTSLLVQVLAAAALLGVSAVQEFATRGEGTPVPFDPPARLVVSGPYAYVRNPMQLSATLVLLGWGRVLGSWWVGLAGAMSVIYAAGFASGDEAADLEQRAGAAWRIYARVVRPWIPRWRPPEASAWAEAAVSLGMAGSRGGDAAPPIATLYVAEECGPCSEVRHWFARRDPVALGILPAEDHPSRTLTRITYDPGDGTHELEGVAAVARALEHVHFGWAMLGMFMRLPGVVEVLQLIVDASGGGPRPAVRYCNRPLAGASAPGGVAIRSP